MKPGEALEVALWLTGRETPEQVEEAEARISQSFDETCARHGVTIGPVIFEEKRPEEDRVPPVPGHISGPNVRLLVATAEVIGHAPEVKLASFLSDLEVDDLERLRVMTRRVYERTYPGRTLSDQDCDAVIEQVGPDAAMAAVREAVDGGKVH